MSRESEARGDKIVPWFVVKNLMMLVISNTTNQGSKMVAVKVVGPIVIVHLNINIKIHINGVSDSGTTEQSVSLRRHHAITVEKRTFFCSVS